MRACRAEFVPRNSLQRVCSAACAMAHVQATNERRAAEAKRAERKADKAKRDKLKTRSDWIKEAQAAFNAWVRLRDAGLPCICCGVPMGDGKPGGAVDAGHYRSTGSAPHLRFAEDNCHAQRKVCNRFGAGRAVDYRLGLIERIGLERVEALEADQTPRKWTIPDLKAIRDTYRAKTRALLKAGQTPPSQKDHDDADVDAEEVCPA